MNIESKLYDYNEAKENLTLRFINKELNAELLEEVPHKNFLDLAASVIYVYDLGKGTHCSICINHEILQGWGKSFEDVYLQAYQNLIFEETVTMPMSEMLSKLIGTSVIEDDLSMYVLTSKRHINGAVHILKENILRYLSEEWESDIFVVPSSVHEVILFPVVDDVTEEEISSIIRSVNATEVKPEDVLSDHVYMYKRSIGWIW